jgi:integrase
VSTAHRSSGHLRPRSYRELERHLLRYCKSLHGLQLQKIDRRTVAARISEVASGSGAATANRVRASLSALFAWAMRQGLLDNNPVSGTNRQPEQSRTRVLSDAELRIIWSALGSDDYSAIVRLLILTGQRRDEIGSLCWSEVADDQIVLPPQRTKNGRGHRIPTVPAVRAILDGRARNGVFVFGRHPTKPFSGWGVSKAGRDQRIRAAGHRLDPWRLHDLRRSLSTAMHEQLGVPPHVVEGVLNHVSGHKAGVAGVYNRANYEREARIALTRWADHVLAVVEGRERKVVSLRSA